MCSAHRTASPKKALVCGADGFIGHHLVNRLKQAGYWVCGVDIRQNTYAPTAADEFHQLDLRDQQACRAVFKNAYDEVYQLAADMGGAGFIFVGENDADIMYNNAIINMNVLAACKNQLGTKILYTSSACVYPEYNQLDPNNPKTNEESAYPAAPDSEYGWEKLFSERMYLNFARCYGIQVRIARLHNIFGPQGSWNDGREKSPAAICRKVASAIDGGTIEIWGDGKQTRSYLYIDECLEGLARLMASNHSEPLNIGSEEMISINDFARLVMKIAHKNLTIKNIPGPTGVRGRTSDNSLIKSVLDWAPSQALEVGVRKTYSWIEQQVKASQHIQSSVA